MKLCDVKEQRILEKKNHLLRAVVILGFLLGAVFFIEDIYVRDVTQETRVSSFQSQLSLDAIMASDPVEDMRDDLPAYFEDEALDLAGYSQVLVSENGHTIGFTSSVGAEEFLDTCKEELRAKGWTYVESGQKKVASFIKSTGHLTWILLDCTSIGDETSVVVQIN